VTEVEIELDNLELLDLDAEIAAVGSGTEVVATTQEAASETGLAIVGSDSIRWPFEAEYWSDETKAYRAFIGEKCTK
jgi:hypothetical protein